MTMRPQVAGALERDRTIDITTTGKKTGQPRRKEIWFHNLDGRLYITGTPGRRDWYANLAAHPEFTFHLKESVETDLEATAVPITDPEERRQAITKIAEQYGATTSVEEWVASSPLPAASPSASRTASFVTR